ncbi:EscJ/YscJ/HrcJ family type III secretion inner membrane ring protein [Chlamydia muridarum str. Nigg]|uniref:Preproteins translocase J n=2 Tax=Chlamydia muridarum TaxID=83560 RepID=A0A070A7S2_CHLMR|nr:type III secretion inner membrane ring lipoprotein SctJ [Chlamydia muridarum]UFT55261.1 EscJ/YscJ/HrcJ family type III secretion inner membrane ring protein [Chlamydia trachomatis]AAF39646.1 type III secretion protein SctJ [Chlamydia muridarum str. Nigg]AHH23234.1 preproteins translocase J [Chlamydia muridarum str. Nigg3 CMUT3-5]AHH24160.1 preproteins translocase J [Chlamydia muridarum str. Nigg CM972]AID38360.1 preproteins translocase J [Chlamydia muridarum str. Nigg 2 MCR]
MFRYTLSRSLFFIFALFCCSACDSRSMIAHGLTGREANEIVVLLVSKGVSAQKVPQVAGSSGGGSSEQLWDISVPAAQITEALAILNQAGLPRMKGTSLLDLFAKQGLVPSEMQEKIRYQEGLSEQMATTIRKMDGIVDASVQISFSPEEDQLPLTASVYIKHRGVLDNPNSIMVSKIKRLVASAVPGLCPENVSVVSDRASYSDITINGPWGLSDEIDYVSVWGIILAKNSLTKFRLVFYFLILLLFVLSCGLLWVIWKTHSLIGALGGTKGFFDPAPYSQLAFTQNKAAAAKETSEATESTGGAQPASEESPKENVEKQEENNEDA